MSEAEIMIVEDEALLVVELKEILFSLGYRVASPANAGEKALKKIEEKRPDLVLMDIKLKGEMDGIETAQQIRAQHQIPVIFLTAFAQNSLLDRAKMAEPFGYLVKPIEPRILHGAIEMALHMAGVEEKQRQAEAALKEAHDELEERVRRRTSELEEANLQLRQAYSEIQTLKEQLHQENIYLREEIKSIQNHSEIVGDSHGIRDMLKKVEQVAPTDATVLILGETGTGKELVARAIHHQSHRKDRAMVTVNCAALPATLVEGELFGREKGAYTGALTKQIGRFEVADGSTIFLDEIGDLPIELQVKLLRVLQEGKFERLGSAKTISVDVRVITATNRDLQTAMQEGKFRDDLYYRLNVFPIQVPPLRQRRDDIKSLSWTFIKIFEATMGKRIDTISSVALEAMHRYSWPGNVRELKNSIERAMITSRDRTLRVEVPDENRSMTSGDMTIEKHERRHILEVLEKTGWRIKGKNGAAEKLGLNPGTLYSRMKKLGIKRSD